MAVRTKEALSLLDIAEIRREKAIRCKASFAYFLKQAWHVIEPARPLIWGIHTEAICEHLQAVGDGELHKLVANIAPGFGKSSTFSVAFPAWIWTRNPYERFLCASYSLDLSIRDNRNCRQLIQSDWYQSLFGDLFQMAGDQNVKSFFENDKKGYRLATATRASGTGKRGTMLLIDDPNNAMAKQAEIEDVTRWFANTWLGRLDDKEKGSMIVVGQRLSENDLTAHIIELGGWDLFVLPNEYESARKCYTSIGWEDPRMVEGELLCPPLLNEKATEGLKHSMGSIDYAAQFQQSPVPAKGAVFQQEWKRYFEIRDEYYILHTKYGRTKAVNRYRCELVVVVDPAISEKQSSDFWVLQVWAITPDNEALLLFQLRGHFTNPDQQKHIIDQYEYWLWNALYVETVAYQLALFQQLKNYDKEEEIAPGVYRKRKVSVPIREWKPVRGDKVARAGVAAIKMEAGDLYWLMHAAYLTELEPEIFKFPKAKHDDQVDCHGMIADILSNPGIPLAGDETHDGRPEAVALAGAKAAAPYTATVNVIRSQEDDLQRQIEALQQHLAQEGNT